MLHYLPTSLIDLLGWTLIHSLWQLSAIAAAVVLALPLLRRVSANARYLLACIALALMMLAPIATFTWLLAHAVQSPVTAASTPAAPIAFPADLPATPLQVAPLRRSPANVLLAFIEPRLPYAVLAYLAGAALFSLRLFAGYARLRRLRRRAKPASPTLQQRLTALMPRLRITRPVRLLESTLVEVPTAFGALRPIILLPATAFTGLSPDQLSALLAHELAHIRRHDYLINLLQTLVETLLFYHPAIWWLSAHIRQEREHACDDLALSAGIPRLTYAKALTEMESLRAPTSLAGIPFR